MKAIAYLCNIPLTTNTLITKEEQKSNIEDFAKKNNITICAWFEDTSYSSDILSRPGVKNMLNYDCDVVLVDRVWVFSRDAKSLEPLFKQFEAKKVRLESATCLWDCVSQMCRKRFTSKTISLKIKNVREVVCADTTKKIKRPEHNYFGELIKPKSQKMTVKYKRTANYF